jgi:AraC-like DNA-binding protein
MDLLTARWRRPFTDDTLGEFVETAAVRPESGDVLLVRAAPGPVPPPPHGASGDGAESPLEALVTGLRRLHPACPVAVWIPDAPADFVIDVVRDSTAASVRAILGGLRPDGGRLRLQLTHPQGLSGFILRWASDAGYLPKGTVQQEVSALLDAAPNVRTLARLTAERQEAARTWRSRLQQMGLPTPRAWLGLAHSLHVAFYLQRNQGQPLSLLAQRLGYSDVTLMSHRFQHVFHMPPGEVRGLLGAEPLLHRWFQGATREVNR